MSVKKPYNPVDLSCGNDYRRTKKEKERQRRKALKKKEKEQAAASSTTTEDDTTTTTTETSSETEGVVNNNNNNNNNAIVVDDQNVDQAGEEGGTELMSEYSKEFLDMETTRPWDKLEMIGTMAITRDEYLARLEKTGNADLTFSFAEGNLHYGKRNPNHFKLNSSKSRAKVKDDHPNDIAKSMTLHHFTSNGLKDNITLIETNVEKFASEGFIGNSDYITASLMPGQLDELNSNGGSKTFELFSRSMDNNSMVFLQQNPGRSHKNIKADIKQFHSNQFTIPIAHPIMSVYGALNPDKPIQPSKDKKLRKKGLVVVSKKFLSDYEPITVDAMKNSISYANITGKEGIVLTFKAPILPEAKAAHAEFVASEGKRGEPYLGFFHGNNDLQVLKINFRLISEYAKAGEEFKL